MNRRALSRFGGLQGSLKSLGHQIRAASSVSDPSNNAGGPSTSTPYIQAGPSSSSSLGSSSSKSIGGSTPSDVSVHVGSSRSEPGSPGKTSIVVVRKRYKLTKTDVGILVAALMSGVGIWHYLVKPKFQKTPPAFHKTLQAVDLETSKNFTIRIKDKKGEVSNKLVKRISKSTADAILRQQERVVSVAKPGNPIQTYYTNTVASNNPSEDSRFEQILAREQPISHGSDLTDLCFFSVFDGHSGTHTSSYLARELIPRVASYVNMLIKGQLPPGVQKTTGWGLSSLIFQSHQNLDADPHLIAQAMSHAFISIDEEIMAAALKGLQAKNVESVSDVKELRKIASPSILPAISGSCALMTYIDAGRNDMYVAVTGDSRAVAGFWDSKENKWRAEPLSEDQTLRNPKEAARLLAAHPLTESISIIRNGRLLGRLEPSRAFGDAKYKWSADVVNEVNQKLLPAGAGIDYPKHSHTPPYLTCQPEITHLKLNSSDSPDFIVMATDGLWDMLSNEEVVALVGRALQTSETKSMTRSELSNHIISDGPAESLTSISEVPRYSFVDTNLSTHLIRNALGGCKERQLTAMLSIPAPSSRRFRDDMTVSVIVLKTPAQIDEGNL